MLGLPAAVGKGSSSFRLHSIVVCTAFMAIIDSASHVDFILVFDKGILLPLFYASRGFDRGPPVVGQGQTLSLNRDSNKYFSIDPDLLTVELIK